MSCGQNVNTFFRVKHKFLHFLCRCSVEITRRHQLKTLCFSLKKKKTTKKTTTKNTNNPSNNLWQTNMFPKRWPPEAAANIPRNTSIKCKPADSQTRQEVKADEQKNNSTEAGEWICKTHPRVRLTRSFRSLPHIQLYLLITHVDYDIENIISQATFFFFFLIPCAERTVTILHSMQSRDGESDCHFFWCNKARVGSKDGTLILLHLQGREGASTGNIWLNRFDWERPSCSRRLSDKTGCNIFFFLDTFNCVSAAGVVLWSTDIQ